jgi:Pyridoxamine 5'-phosphate oxidase
VLDQLPDCRGRTIGVLATGDPDPHVIPVSAPQRAGDHRILLSLHFSRGSLARLRAHPEVALMILAGGDVAFTAHGRARIVQESMSSGPDYAAVAIDVGEIDDHRQAEFTVEGGVDRSWRDEEARRAMAARVQQLKVLAGAS